MKNARNITATPIRIPEELKNWLKHKAIDNYRSLNGEIVARLEESRKREEEQVDEAA
ncbi:Arc family DNA-binding protein [Chromobacterium haemolyticum]|uniref:Arc family DNA-binding protein n=1 Tax=Chromobacterium haemolyticum TaxID=394935 RepID=UPI0011308B44|nr:Arc family DNA-binding protein [Chromobacterium haemolyticum]